VIDHDLVYITDACNHRLNVFKTDGTFIRNMGSTGSALGQFRFPYGLDEDKGGHLIVCEFGNNRVQLIDKETGKGLAACGTGTHSLRRERCDMNSAARLILLVVIVLLLIAVLPTWPYSTGWGIYPSGGIGLLLVIVIILLLLNRAP